MGMSPRRGRDGQAGTVQIELRRTRKHGLHHRSRSKNYRVRRVGKNKSVLVLRTGRGFGQTDGSTEKMDVSAQTRSLKSLRSMPSRATRSSLHLRPANSTISCNATLLPFLGPSSRGHGHSSPHDLYSDPFNFFPTEYSTVYQRASGQRKNMIKDITVDHLRTSRERVKFGHQIKKVDMTRLPPQPVVASCVRLGAAHDALHVRGSAQHA